ncbi:hypothetical protein C8R47DRAFT_1215954 [Mycena vitilis]|nr:hypothetical protein C8R47DRAFT_1215954 [Mycena vitilis]
MSSASASVPTRQVDDDYDVESEEEFGDPASSSPPLAPSSPVALSSPIAPSSPMPPSSPVPPTSRTEVLVVQNHEAPGAE